MDELKKGMVVQLKSGGPAMTIEEINPELDKSIVCAWFSGNKREIGTFHPKSLRIIEEEN